MPSCHNIVSDGNVTSSKVLCWIRNELGYTDGERKCSDTEFVIPDCALWHQRTSGVVVKTERQRIRSAKRLEALASS